MPRGGKRPNAGRKTGSINRLTALERASHEIKEISGGAARRAVTAAAVLGSIDEMATWLRLLKDKSAKVRLDALQYLTDQRDGKAKQKMEIKADIASRITQMTDEELEQFALGQAVAGMDSEGKQ